MSSQKAIGETHIIQFPNGNFTYSPASQNVAVGDVIRWEGPFSDHPLVPDQFPQGAVVFDMVTTGSSFEYVVQVAGTYTFYCNFHGSPGGGGMSGSFTAQASGVNDPKETFFSLSAIVPNPVIGKTTISFSLERPATVSVRILSIDGKEIAAPVHSFLSEGQQSVDFDASSLDGGVYIAVLEADGIRKTQQMVVTK